jgi:hypothetical protein
VQIEHTGEDPLHEDMHDLENFVLFYITMYVESPLQLSKMPGAIAPPSAKETPGQGTLAGPEMERRRRGRPRKTIPEPTIASPFQQGLPLHAVSLANHEGIQRGLERVDGSMTKPGY